MRLIEGDRVTTQQVINSSASVDLVLVAAVGAFFVVDSSHTLENWPPISQPVECCFAKKFLPF